MNDLTVLIPTSPIPSHPSTAILDETIANIRKYTDAKIIIMFDGKHHSVSELRWANYLEYYEAVMLKSELYGSNTIVKFPAHNHQSGMTKYALCNLVKTPLVMFCEHDTSPIGEIPFDDICECVKISDHIKCVRFNIFDKIPDEHQYLMIDKKPEFYYQEIGRRHGPEVWLTRTIQWSQRPHIAKTEWYKNIILTYFTNNSRCMIEDVMHGRVQADYEMNGQKDFFGLAIYTPEGNQLRSYHADGRGSDEKLIYG